MRRLTGAVLLLYPRRIRKRHGAEIMALIDDLIAHEGRSRTAMFMRLAMDGLVQRIASTATAWTVAVALVATSFGGLAVSDFAAANALPVKLRTVHTLAPARHTHQTPHHIPRSHRTPQVGWDDHEPSHFGAILTASVTAPTADRARDQRSA